MSLSWVSSCHGGSQKAARLTGSPHDPTCVLKVCEVPSGWRSDRCSSSRETAAVRCLEERAALKGAFFSSSLRGNSTLLWDSLGADIIWNLYGVKERKYVLPKHSPPLSPPWCAPVSRAGLKNKKAHASVRVYIPVSSFSGAPKHQCVWPLKERDWGWTQVRNQEVGGSVRECSGAPAARRAAARQAAASQSVSLSLDEWEFVWCMRADLICQKRTSHVREVLHLFTLRLLFFVLFCSVLFCFFAWLVWVATSRRMNQAARFVGSLSCSIGRGSLCAPTHKPFRIVFICHGYF